MTASHPWLSWYGNTPANIVYPEVTLYEALASVCRRVPDSIAWDFFDTTATYRDFLQSIDTCANAFACLGLKPGERILIAMPTSPQGIIAFYAVNKLGAVPALVHPLSTTSELEHYLNLTGARIALTLDLFYDNLAAVQTKVPLETLILARISDYLPPLKSLGFFLSKGGTIPPPRGDRRVRWWTPLMNERHPVASQSAASTHDPAAILFSGGTTGRPRGVVLSNFNFISEGMAVAAWGGMHDVKSILAIMPIFHGFGLGVCVNAAFMNGGKSILVPTFSPKIVAELLRKKRPNALVGVPTLFAALTHNQALARADLSCLRATFSGADVLSRSVKEQFEQFVAQRGGNVKLLEGYGLTETVTAIIAMPHTEYREGSIGVPFPDTIVKICKPGGRKEVKPGVEGEICIAGPAVMIGYLDDPEATAQSLRVHADGRTWLHTGDLARMDADGFFYFKERLKRLIKSSGFNVFPGQVESVLREHPLVSQACVVGVPDASQVERVKAFVVLKDGAPAGAETERALIEHCRLQLIKWSCPREIEFRCQLPQTRLGKIDYKVLVQEHIERNGNGAGTADEMAHGGDLIAADLKANGVRWLFTLCGGHISPILTAAKARGIRVLDVRDEATAVFAADAVSRLTGTPGVAVVTAGPGLTNTLTALQNAKLAQSPVILLGGAVPTALQDRGALQDIDQQAVVAPHVKLERKVRRSADLTQTIAEAFKLSREGVPGPVFIECPVDLLYDEASVRKSYAGASGTGNSLSARLLRLYLKQHVDRMFARGSKSPARALKVMPPTPAESSVRAAASALKRASRPLIVMGSQSLAIPAEAKGIAEAISQLGIPVFLSGMARGLLGRHHCLQMFHQRKQALKESDCILLAGMRCDFRLDYGRQLPGAATLIVANRSRKDASQNCRPDIAAVGDAGQFLKRLAQQFGDAGDHEWKHWIEKLRYRDAVRELEILEHDKSGGQFVNPIALLKEIDRLAGDNAVFVADGGDFAATASYIIRPRGPLSWLDPGVFGTLGSGAGFALGACISRPDAEVWILYGDGSCGYSLLEFDTFVRHRLPVIAVVGNDASWSQIAREQVKMLNDDVGTVLARSDYHRVASALGARGILVKTAGELPEALVQARATARSGRPVLVNVWLDRSDFRQGSISM